MLIVHTAKAVKDVETAIPKDWKSYLEISAGLSYTILSIELM